jgi:hypothetical protein
MTYIRFQVADAVELVELIRFAGTLVEKDDRIGLITD